MGWRGPSDGLMPPSVFHEAFQEIPAMEDNLSASSGWVDSTVEVLASSIGQDNKIALVNNGRGGNT